ncbi:MAG: LysM peptidoglycan-binding domain-containing protein [Desulfobulbia bacterium]
MPLEYETVHVPGNTHLKAVALACAVGVGGIQDLNPQLCKSITPPRMANYPLRVPVGKKALVSLNLPRVREVVTTEYRDYVTAKGETLSSICKKHGIRKTALVKANKLRHERLTPSQRIKIPYQDSHYVLPDVAATSGGATTRSEKNGGEDISRAIAFEEHGSSKRKHSKAETFKKQQDHKKLKHKPGSGSDGGKGVAATSGLKRKLRPTLSGIQKKAPSRSYAVTVGTKRPKRS